MTRIAIVMASELSRHQRMDAPFHIAVSRTREAVETLKARHTEAEAIEMLDQLDVQSLAAIAPLLRGGSSPRTPDREQYQRAVRDYPHIALALVREDAARHAERIRRDIAEGERRLMNIESIMGDE